MGGGSIEWRLECKRPLRRDSQCRGTHAARAAMYSKAEPCMDACCQRATALVYVLVAGHQLLDSITSPSLRMQENFGI